MTHNRTEELAVINLISAMTKSQRREMLRDIVEIMADRDDVEEIADFVLAQMGGGAVEVASGYIEGDRDE